MSSPISGRDVSPSSQDTPNTEEDFCDRGSLMAATSLDVVVRYLSSTYSFADLDSRITDLIELTEECGWSASRLLSWWSRSISCSTHPMSRSPNASVHQDNLAAAETSGPVLDVSALEPNAAQLFLTFAGRYLSILGHHKEALAHLVQPRQCPCMASATAPPTCSWRQRKHTWHWGSASKRLPSHSISGGRISRKTSCRSARTCTWLSCSCAI